MAELEFIKGLYDEGKERIDERKLLQNVIPVLTAEKAIDTLMKMTKDNGIMSKALKGIDPSFAKDLKVLNRQIERVAEDYEKLIGEASSTELANQ